jgi:DNA recombination protein RmuC
MSESATLLTILLGLILVAVAGCLVLLLRKPAQAAPADQSEAAVLRERLAARDQEIARLQQQLDNFQAQLQQAREQMNLEFRNLANEILEQKGKSFSETSRQHIQDILKPLGEKIVAFERKVEDTYGKEALQRFALEKEIKALHEANLRISVEADNLAKALKGESKTQGIWGEVILERVLEQSGLQKGREYETQVSLKDDSGRLRQPDVIVNLPDGKHVIIDSKVSLTAYEGYSSATDEETRATLLKQHIQSIRGHIKGLSEKNYQNLGSVQSLNFVLLFLPVEPAFTLAIHVDDRLFIEAFEQNIVLVGPSTLLTTLRTIKNSWQNEDRNRNALEIATQAGALYDKFVAFTEDVDRIGERLSQTQKAYDDAHNKLASGRGNLMARAEKLRKLGAKTTKQLSAQSVTEEDGEEEQGEGKNA